MISTPSTSLLTRGLADLTSKLPQLNKMCGYMLSGVHLV